MINAVVGMLDLALGLTLTTTIVSRLWEYWDGFQRAQKILLFGLMVIMFGFTERGIELLWFNAPGPRPAAVLGLIGALMATYALLSPVDERLRPASWQSAMKKQDPDNYDRFLEILNKSATARNTSTDGAKHYKTTFEESD